MNICNYSLNELESLAREAGGSTVGARRLFSLIYRHNLASLPDAGNISRAFLQRLQAEGISIDSLRKAARRTSADGTVKYVLELDDALRIESVLIPGRRDRRTLCISTQAGCAMGCRFCSTASMGLLRNLTVAEIVGQILAVNRELAQDNLSRVDNIVLMGMGEPLHNFDNTIRALEIMQEEAGLGLSPRKITMSTCGLLPELCRFAEQSPVQIAVSLHAADDTLRSRLMPVNRRAPLAQLLDCCRDISRNMQRQIMFEYALLRGVNDSADQARELALQLKGMDCKINLLTFNPCPGLPFEPSDPETMQRFRDILIAAGHLTLVRRSRGDDIAAACGQLAGSGG